MLVFILQVYPKANYLVFSNILSLIKKNFSKFSTIIIVVTVFSLAVFFISCCYAVNGLVTFMMKSMVPSVLLYIVLSLVMSI